MRFRSLCFCIALVMSIVSYSDAQRMPGYIVLNSKDTLRGEIKKPTAKYLLHHEVYFWAQGDTKSYHFAPNELKSFSVDNEVYESHFIYIGKKRVKKFLKPFTEDDRTLYEYVYTEKSSKGIVSTPIRSIYEIPSGRLVNR